MPTLDELDATYRAEQAQNAAAASKLILAQWVSQIDPDNIAGTARSWLDEAVQIILSRRSRAYSIAVDYSLAVRKIQIPGASPISIPQPPPPPVEKITTSLTYTGIRDLAIKLGQIPEPTDPAEDPFRVDPISDADRARFQREEEASQQAKKKAVQVSGAKAAASAYKEVVNGGRDTTDEQIRTQIAIGYMRITKANPCAFCLMLASRGPVYRDDSFDRSDPRFTGPGEHKVHDSCGCGLRPIYKRGQENWTERAREADKIWREQVSSEFSGQDAINAFARITRELGIADLTRW